MCKLIKKQIKRSLPMFLIFTLLTGTLAVGLVFNYDFNLQTGKDLFTRPFAQAAPDSATTTVTVLNAPPVITTDPAEVPASASTSPRNIGGDIGFTVTADDPENNDYFLIVCTTNAVSPANNSNPTCGGRELCMSATTTDETPASCTYDPIVDEGVGVESLEWYAFVCDTHLTEAICSVASQGTTGANSASPMYLNHAPNFTAVFTFDDNKDPDNAADPFRVRATTTDPDVLGGPDGQHLFVCLSDVWSDVTGCDIQLCHGVATSTNSVECSFATTTIAADGTYNYFAFVKDWHGLAANNGNSRSNTYTVNNVAPVVGAVSLNSNTEIILNMKNSEEVVVTTNSVNVLDKNGCADILDATSTIYWSEVAGAENCTANDNNCYKLNTTECAVVPGSCGAYPDAVVEVVCTTTMAYHAMATDNTTGNPYSGDSWLAALTAIDDNGARHTATSTVGVDVRSLQALHIEEERIEYGSVRGGQNSSTTLATSTIANYGNVPIDTNIQGTDMVKIGFAETIPVNNQKFDNVNFSYDTLTFNLGLGDTLIDIVVPKPISQATTSDEVYWGINIPGGTSSGDYAGTNTFTAIVDDNGGW